MIKNREKVLLANNTALVFVLFLFLYGFSNCVIDEVYNGSIRDFVYWATLIYASTIPAFLIGNTLNKHHSYDKLYHREVESVKLSRAYNIVLIILLIIFICYKSFFFYSIGLFFNPYGLVGQSRNIVFKDVSQLYIVIGFLINGIYAYFIYFYKKTSKKLKVFLVIVFVYYVFLQLFAGNRRDFLPVIVAFFWVFVNVRKIKFNLKWFVALLIAVVLFNYIGAIRSNLFKARNFQTSEVVEQSLTSNEFTYPFFTLAFPVRDYMRSGSYDFMDGKSIFLYPLEMFIPRAIYPSKPRALAIDFIWKYYGTDQMGYAFTPVSEAFINFGFLGPFLFYLFFGLLIYRIQKRNNQRVNYLFFIMAIDFCRGEVGTFIYQFFFVSFFLFVLPSIKNIIVPKTKIR